MRIAFNGQRLAGQRFGVGRYIEYMLRYWSEQLGGDEEVTVFVRRPLESAPAWLSPQINVRLLESNQSGIVWENLHLAAAAARYDALFCPAYTAPILYSEPLVVATHSVNETQPSAHSWLYKQTYARLHKYCARKADAVIVPGADTKTAVIDHYGVDAVKITVVHQGADEAFHPINDDVALAAVRKRFFGADRPYLLFVGKCSRRRNIPALIEAYAHLRKTRQIPHGLVLFGPVDGMSDFLQLCETLGVRGDVVQTDGAISSHAELAPVYAAADVFVHPSENEGWSMTTVEALACGTAVVAADRGGLGEVARGHALMVDTPSVDNLAEAIGRVLADEALRHDLQRSGRARGAALGWRESAQQTLDVVRAAGRRARSTPRRG